MLFLSPEILVDDGPEGRHAQAVFDLSRTQLAAVAAALSHHRRTRFGSEALGTDDVLELRSLLAVAEQVDELAALEGHAAVRVGPDGASALAQAALVYLRDRDTESYQSPEERERLAALRDLADPLVELACELRGAEQQAPAGDG